MFESFPDRYLHCCHGRSSSDLNLVTVDEFSFSGEEKKKVQTLTSV